MMQKMQYNTSISEGETSRSVKSHHYSTDLLNSKFEQHLTMLMIKTNLLAVIKE